MSGNFLLETFNGEICENQGEMSLAELCRICRLPAEHVLELVEEGILVPEGRTPEHWRFASISVWRVRCALRLQQDLGVNTAGAALALDLLEELQRLQSRLRRLEG